MRSPRGSAATGAATTARSDINKAVEVAKRVKGVKSVNDDMILKGTQ